MSLLRVASCQLDFNKGYYYIIIIIIIVCVVRFFGTPLKRHPGGETSRVPNVLVSGLFVPLHFRSRERKVHRENFRSRGTLIPWNIRSQGAKSPRTFVPRNFRTPSLLRSECSKNFCSMELSHPWNVRSTPQTTSVPCETFAAVLKKVVESRKTMFP